MVSVVEHVEMRSAESLMNILLASNGLRINSKTLYKKTTHSWLSKCISGPVHSNPFSNEKGAVLLRIRLSSTLQRQNHHRKRSHSKTLSRVERLKTMLLKTLFSSVGGHDRAPDHSTVSIQNGGQTLPCGFCLDRCCSADGRKRCKNDKCRRKSF